MRTIGFLLFLLGWTSVHAAEPTGVALLDFRAKGILDKAVLRQLWERSQEIASGIPSADMLSTEETRKRVFDQNILVASRCDAACYQRIAQKLGTKEILVPSVEKTGDQLKFTFARYRGANGQKVQEVSVWSDGRVGRALTTGLFKVFDGASEGNAITIPPAAWKSFGVLGVGLGTIWFLGTGQERESVSRVAPPIEL